MQKSKYLKQLILLIGLMLPTAWNGAYCTNMTDGNSHINIKGAKVQGIPKGYAIDATIQGHTLTVTFTENLGQVSIEISTVSGAQVTYTTMSTPNGYMYYISLTGDYIITFTLPNGDEYYGEFTVTD